VYAHKPLVTVKTGLILRFSDILPEYILDNSKVHVFMSKYDFRLIRLVSSFSAFYSEFLLFRKLDIVIATGPKATAAISNFEQMRFFGFAQGMFVAGRSLLVLSDV